MRFVKSLIIMVLLLASSVAKGQDDKSLLDEIDFNDTTLIENDSMWLTIAEYITMAQKSNANPKNQEYNMILAADDVLSRAMVSYQMYAAVFQYLINGFSELGANMVVDYMTRTPYLEYVNADVEKRNEIINIAKAYERVKVGQKAPDIQSVTIFDKSFDLTAVDKRYIVLLFWSYSCPHCHDLMNELGRLASDNDEVAVVTINVSGSLNEVRRMVRKAKLKNQYNICDSKGWDSPIVDDYAVDMTPSLFLLDENKVIISKPFDIEDVINNIEL